MNSLKSIKEALCCLLLFFSSFTLFAQKKEANNWFWGIRAGLSFNYTPPKPLFDSKIFTSYSNASISDSAGKLLFYTDGDSLFRKNARTVLLKYRPQIGLDPNASHRASLIIPDLKNDKKFWVAVVSSSNKPGHRNVLITFAIDMNKSNGKGNIDSTSVSLMDTIVSSTISVMQHADGKRNWLIGRHFETDTLLAWLVDTVVHKPPVVSKMFSPYPDYPNSSTAQVCKTSPNSEILFWGWGQRETRCNQLVKFNRATGKFYDRIHMVDSVTLKPKNVNYNFPVDAAFSPDSRYLYTVENTFKFNRDSTPVSVHQQNRIYYTIRQYNLSVWDSAAIKNSGRVVFQSGPFMISGANALGPMTCQLGPDGKIYFQEFNQTRLSVMHCPSSQAPNVNFKFREINIQRIGGLRMPTLNQTFVRNAGIFQVQANKRKLCKGDTLELSGYGAGAEHFKWSVSPALPVSVKVDTLTWQKISTTAIPAGIYTFTCQSFSRCGDVNEKSLQIEILPLPARPNLSLMQKPVPCKGDSVIIRVQTPVSGNRYFWSTGDSTSSIVVKQTGLYSLDSVSNTFGCGIRVGDTVGVNIKNAVIPPVPMILGPKLVEVCEGQKAKLTIDNGQLTIQYKWSNGVVGDSVFVGSGQYSVISESAEGCQSGSSDTVRVVFVPHPTPAFINLDSVLTRESLLNQNYCVTGLPGSRFSFVVQGGQVVDSSEDCITVRWNRDTGKWYIQATETLDNPPCAGSVSQTFSYRPHIEIPNLITPNGDGKNETFVIQDLEFYPSHRLQIFNRWGKKVLDTFQYNQDWHGEEGIYYYSLMVDGKGFSGWVMVTK